MPLSENASKVALMGALAVITSGTVLLSKFSRGPHVQPHDTVLVIFLAELGKLGISVMLLLREDRQAQAHSKNELASTVGKSQMALARLDFAHPSILLFSVPALLYALQNNLTLLSLSYVTASVFQTINQMKILTTAVLWWLVFRKPVSALQWGALVLLTCGAITAQYQCDTAAVAELPTAGATPSSSSLGVLLVLLICVLSALSGVSLEWLIRRSDDTNGKRGLNLQNSKLYIFGVLLNGAAVVSQWDNISSNPVDSFGGVTQPVVMLLIVLNACTGLLVSVVVKRLNTIYKTIAVTIALMLSLAISLAFFGEELRFLLVDGIVITALGVLAYNYEGW